ncbi:GMC oxidoreductase, partial [Rhizoctonia solani]
MVSEQITKGVLERAPKPTFPNYEQRGRPLSYQPRFYEVDKQPANNYGFPEPGIQAPTAKQVTAKDFMVSDLTWEDLCVNGKDAIDYIVIGSGFTALAFIDETLKRDPRKMILCLERGDFWLPDHFQNLPLPFKYTLGGPSETFPFTLSEKTFNSPVRFVHGSTPFFGGRSTFWSAWSPSPDEKLMRGWPKSMIDTSKEAAFFRDAIELLRVTDANEIGPPYYREGLQKQVHERLHASLPNIPTATETRNAPMSVSPMAQTSTVRFTKFSTPGPLLGLYKKQQNLVKADPNKASPLLFATDTAVEFLITDVGYPGKVHEASKDKTVTLVRSSRHTDLPVSEKTKIILCAGAFPNTTLVQNSFASIPALENAGKTVTGHFLSHIVGRVPRSAFKGLKDSIEIGAEYLAGKDPETELQYHIQITSIASPHQNQDAEDAARFCPDYAASASDAQLKESQDHVIFVCATLGELCEGNSESFFRRNPYSNSKDATANCVLQVVLDDKDKKLWNVMDQATFEAIEVMAGEEKSKIEWWHEPKGNTDPSKVGWRKNRPGQDTIRMEGIVHEAGLLPMGEPGDRNACVDSNYKLKGVSNVYVTGACLFPTSGSWNPTLTMCGYAQDLAKKLTPHHNQQ